MSANQDLIGSEQPGLIQRTEDSSAAIFDNVFLLYGYLDREGNILDLRGRIFADTNANPEFLVRQPFAETVFWQTSEANARMINTAIQAAIDGGSPRLHLDFRLRAEEKVPLIVSFQPIVSPEGEKRIFVYAQSPTTPLRKEEEGNNEFLLLGAEIADVGLWYWDNQSNHLFTTPGCNELFALTAYDELTFAKVLKVVYPEDIAFVEGFVNDALRKGTKFEEEFRVIYPDGKIEWICAEGRSFVDQNGEPVRMVGTVQKITDQKLASDELERVYELEKKARDEAEIANKSKDFFLAFVSHELRSPLNAILGWSRILQTRDVDEATRKKALETIEKSAVSQTKLINDLVDTARVASGKLRLEYRQANLVDVVRSSFEAQKPAAESLGITYKFSTDRDPIGIFADSVRLHQVFGNLISNAIKFTPKDGEVSVDIVSFADRACITIADTGQGIDPNSLPNIFKQFSQGDAENVRRSGGLGLGLSIVNILVGKHGGTVTANSQGIGEGASFTVTLPLTEGTELTAADAVETVSDNHPRRLEGIRVLVVEDDPDSREVLQIFLEQNGASVRTADSARTAMHLFSETDFELPDVLISDIAMPEEDGYSLIARIRSMPAEKGGNIPALALSAFASAESKQKAHEAGFTGYLTKPFEPESTVQQVYTLGRKAEPPA